MNPEPSGSLEEQVGELRSRVRRLEEALTRQGVLSHEFIDQPAAEAAVTTAESAAAVPWTEELKSRKDAVAAQEAFTPGNALREAASGAPVAAPSFGYVPIGAAEEASLESRIGSHWFNRIGILANQRG